MPLMQLVITLVVVGVLLWLVNRFIPLVVNHEGQEFAMDVCDLWTDQVTRRSYQVGGIESITRQGERVPTRVVSEFVSNATTPADRRLARMIWMAESSRTILQTGT